MPDLVHRLIRFSTEVFSRLQIASRGCLEFHFGTIVVANWLAESELMSELMRRDTAPPTSRFVGNVTRNMNLHPAFNARTR